MKKITIFSLHLGYGGIEKCVVNLANLLVDTYDVEIVSTYKLEDTPAFDINEKVKVRYLISKYKPNREEWKQSIRKIRPIKFIKETYKAIIVLFNRRRKTVDAIKKCDSDIIISTRDLFNKWVSTYAKGKSYKIAWEHNHHHNDMVYAKKVVKSCYNMDTLVLVSDSLRSFYKKQMKEANYKCKCVFIPNMIEDIPKNVSKLNTKNLISIGRLAKEKGVTDLIELFKELKEKNPKENYHLHLVGDGAERNKVVDMIYGYDLTKDITVHGYLKKKDINVLFKDTSLYLMTSYTESFGLVLVEAMAHGLPIISSNLPTSKEIMGDFGLYFKNENVRELAQKMEEATLIDWNEKSKRAIIIAHQYDIDHIIIQWKKLIEE